MTDKTSGPRSLSDLLADAKAWWLNATPAEKAKMKRDQRRSMVISEAAFGSDADEVTYRAAHQAGDVAAMARLQQEGEARAQRAAQIMDEQGL